MRREFFIKSQGKLSIILDNQNLFLAINWEILQTYQMQMSFTILKNMVLKKIGSYQRR